MEDQLDAKEKLILILMGIIFVLLALGSHNTGPEFSGVSHVQRQ